LPSEAWRNVFDMGYMIDRGDADESAIGTQTMAHPVAKEFLERANTALLLGLVCGGLAFCAFGAIAVDASRWLAH
jgi:hypothetical protein